MDKALEQIGQTGVVPVIAINDLQKIKLPAWQDSHESSRAGGFSSSKKAACPGYGTGEGAR